MSAPAVVTSLIKEYARWRETRLAELTKEDGWLTLVNLIWLDDGWHQLGSASSCDIQLTGTPPRFGTLSVTGNAAEWQPDGGMPQVLHCDSSGSTSVIHHDAISFFLIERDGRLALRVRDANSATRRDFTGIDCFPFNPAWQVEARWDGALAHFRMGDTNFTLRPQKPAADLLHFVFADQTSGRETYGGGRFLHAAPTQSDRLLLDFNRAINPPCAFTPFAVCPLPPPENRLPIAVTAGEKCYSAPNR